MKLETMVTDRRSTRYWTQIPCKGTFSPAITTWAMDTVCCDSRLLAGAVCGLDKAATAWSPSAPAPAFPACLLAISFSLSFKAKLLTLRSVLACFSLAVGDFPFKPRSLTSLPSSMARIFSAAVATRTVPVLMRAHSAAFWASVRDFRVATLLRRETDSDECSEEQEMAGF